MQPRPVIVTIRHKVYGQPDHYGYPTFHEETEQVPAKVWPVAMSPDEMLVEYDDGSLGAVKLRDIRMGGKDG